MPGIGFAFNLIGTGIAAGFKWLFGRWLAKASENAENKELRDEIVERQKPAGNASDNINRLPEPPK